VKIARKTAIGLLSLFSIISSCGCFVSLCFFARAAFPFNLSGVITAGVWAALFYGSFRLWAWPLRKLGIELTAQGPRSVP
jgi:hypothetical protein